MRFEDLDDYYERENSPTAEFMLIQTQAGRSEIWLDFYIDEEEENTYDNGPSMIIDDDVLAKLTFEATYENFYQFREIYFDNSYDIQKTIEIANEKFANK